MVFLLCQKFTIEYDFKEAQNSLCFGVFKISGDPKPENNVIKQFRKVKINGKQ